MKKAGKAWELVQSVPCAFPPQEQQFVPSPFAPHEVQVGRWGGRALLSCFPAFLINQENRWGAEGGGFMNEESKKAGNAEN